MGIVNSSLFNSLFGSFKDKEELGKDYDMPLLTGNVFKPANDLKQMFGSSVNSGISFNDLNDALRGVDETTSIDQTEIDSTLEDVKPVIKYPGYKSPTKPKDKTDNDTSFSSFQPLVTSPTPLSRFVPLGRSVPLITTNCFVFEASIGNPTGQNTFTNFVNNSNKDRIYFTDNVDVIRNAVEEFNLKHDISSNKIHCKIMSGDLYEYKESFVLFQYIKFLDSIDKFVVVFVPVIQNSLNYADEEVIKKTCKFFLTGDIILDENEEKIADMTIESVSYKTEFMTASMTLV